MAPHTYVGPSRFGRGVFTRQGIEAGTVVMQLNGRVMRFREVVSHKERTMDVLQIGIGLYIDLEPPAVYINHSCDPNLGITDDLELVSITEIMPGEELFYDYSTTMLEEFETMECHCESSACRGLVGDFDGIPESAQARYLSLRIVPSFIVNEVVNRQQKMCS